MFLIRKYSATLVATLLCSMIAFPAYLFPGSLLDDGAESWTPNDSPKSYRNLAEERFSMECDYLEIGGERVKAARLLFDTMLAERQEVDSARAEGSISRVRAIGSINKIELAYYLKLKNLITGKRNLGRIGRLIAKVRGRNECRNKPPALTR